ncbi:MAG: DUF4346 domain-containing protein [Desulfitobacteriaceae bacterium]
MTEWLRHGNQNRHKCLGCETCLPIEPYNQFSLAIRGLSNPTINNNNPGLFNMVKTSCGCGTSTPTEQPNLLLEIETKEKWPVVEGDYLIGNRDAKIAVCTLADPDLPNELETVGFLEKVALVGPLSTENLGIEKVVRNIVSNPSIGYLILCGKDSRGHKAGQAILSLKENGMSQDGNILGAVGPRPILKNITNAEVEAFKANIDVIDEIGTTDIERLRNIIEQCMSKPKEKPLSLPPKNLSSKVIVAEPTKEWEPDPEGFFVILTDAASGSIICEHYATESVRTEVIKGTDATSIYKTAIHRGLLSRLDHAAYLGKELEKAEIALGSGKKYIQDFGIFKGKIDKCRNVVYTKIGGELHVCNDSKMGE